MLTELMLTNLDDAVSMKAPNKSEEHFADREHKSLSLHNVVHLPKLVPKARNTPEAKVTVDKKCFFCRKFVPVWQESKVRNTKRNRGSTIRMQSSSFSNVIGLIPLHKWELDK